MTRSLGLACLAGTTAVVVAGVTSAHAQVSMPYDKCGTYIAGQESCVLFQPDDGTQDVWAGSPPAPYTLGSHVRLRGTFIYCPSPCMAPCVTNPTVSDCPPPCRADFDNDGHLAVQDIFAFISAWFAQSPGADFDGSGSTTTADVFAFIAAWFTGC